MKDTQHHSTGRKGAETGQVFLWETMHSAFVIDHGVEKVTCTDLSSMQVKHRERTSLFHASMTCFAPTPDILPSWERIIGIHLCWIEIIWWCQSIPFAVKGNLTLLATANLYQKHQNSKIQTQCLLTFRTILAIWLSSRNKSYKMLYKAQHLNWRDICLNLDPATFYFIKWNGRDQDSSVL